MVACHHEECGVMALTNLTTVDEVIEVLGGVGAVARATRRGATAVHNWRSSKRIPASLYLKLTSRLKKRGYSAADTLWTFERDRIAA
jgi:hypothetical protein